MTSAVVVVSAASTAATRDVCLSECLEKVAFEYFTHITEFDFCAVSMAAEDRNVLANYQVPVTYSHKRKFPVVDKPIATNIPARYTAADNVSFKIKSFSSW